MMAPHSFISQAQEIVGQDYVITDESKMERFLKGFRFGYGKALAVVQPGTLLEMWQIAQACVVHDLILIMQASNTGLTGGSTPDGDYDRPVVLLSTLRLKGIQLINQDTQAVAFPGATLYELEDELAKHGREPHSVIGSSCIGASIIGGICNNSGGALIRRGPAYTELSCYAKLHEDGVLRLHNELGIDLGDDPETILTRLYTGDYRAEHIINDSNKLASDHEYKDRVREVDADTPARFNNDGRRLYGASGSAGRLLVFAVRVDTFESSKREQVFYIGTNDPAHLAKMRREILKGFKELPVSGEYMHRDYFDVAEKYGRDTVRVILQLGSKYIPKLFAFKSQVDRILHKLRIFPNHFSDKAIQFMADLMPSHLPKFMHDYRQKYEHHLILKMADEGIEEAQAYLTQFFKDHEGDFHVCTPQEGKIAGLHRFAAAGASGRYHSILGDKVGELVALDVALRRNEEDWFERLPPEVDKYFEAKLYCGHFFCYVMHQDYFVKKGVDPDEAKKALLALFDQRGAEYPAEHNVGHLYKAKDALRQFYRDNDPSNSFNPGIGKTARLKNWCDCEEHRLFSNMNN